MASIAVDQGGTWGWTSPPTILLVVLSGALFVTFVLREGHVSAPLIDLHLFRNFPFVLVTSMGAVSNALYSVTIFVASLYIQDARGLSPLLAGTVFLAPAVMVALSGPLGGRLAPHFRPSAVMAAAGVVASASVLALTFVTRWWAYVPIFALAGLGLGLGWTFANVSTQDLVRAERAGEASGVVLTVLVTMGGIGMAAAAASVAALQGNGHTLTAAFELTLRIFSLICLGWAVAVMVVRHILVRAELMAPLSMKRPFALRDSEEVAIPGGTR